MLAVLFRVIATYDDDVRWQRDADAMKALCLKAADACRHGTEESFEVARQTQQVLGDLLRGQSLQGLGLEVEELGEMTELALLMQRMDRGMKQVSNVPSSNAATFREQSFDIGHEARLMAMLALLIQQDDFYFADDEDYVEQAEALRHFAGELSAACIAEDQQAAVESFRGAVQSCSRCHEDYRG